MCGRFAFGLHPEDFLSVFHNNHIDNVNVDLSSNSPASYNIAPTNYAPVITGNNPKLTVRSMQFGLRPFWAKAKAPPLSTFNAKKESLISGSKVWSPSLAYHRCVIPVQGYYEWLHKSEKIPYYIHKEDSSQLIYLAAIWSKTEIEGKEEPLYSFAIITGNAPKQMKWLHHRMPIMLAPGSKEWKLWMANDGKLTTKQLDEALKERLLPGVAWYEVSKDINSSRTQGKYLIEPKSNAPKKRRNDVLAMLSPKKAKKESAEGEKGEFSEVKESDSKVKKEPDSKSKKSEQPQKGDKEVIEVEDYVKKEDDNSEFKNPCLTNLTTDKNE